MDSINSILSSKNFEEPPEIERIKRYIKQNYDSESIISLSRGGIVISVNSASLVANLRLNAPELSRKLKIDKKLVFRVH